MKKTNDQPVAGPIAAAVALGPLPGDARDLHERVVAQEAPGSPELKGALPYRIGVSVQRAADAERPRSCA